MAKSKNSILLLSVMDSWGGGEEVLLKIALHVEGFQFYIATPPGMAAEKFLSNKLNIFRLARLKKIYRSNNKGWSFQDKLKVLINIVVSIFPLYSFMKRKNIATIAANGNFAALFALPFTIILKKKLVVIQHLLYENNSFEGKLLKILAKHADQFICVSRSVAENIESFIGEELHNKLTVIHNGLSVENFREENLAARVSPTEIRFAIVGSIIPEKGHNLVFDTFCEVVSNYPECRLFIFGEPREENNSKSFYNSLQEKKENLVIADKIIFKGYLEQKSDLYNQFDILINYSLVPESFSMVVLEALAYNKIVIASKEGGPGEIITHNENGFLIEPRNKQALFQMMLHVASQFDTISMNNLRKNGISTVKENFSLQHFAESYKNIFYNYSYEGN